MRLYVEEIKAAPLVQQITIENRTLVSFVRLHLCKYLSPAGNFTVQITDDSDNVLASCTQSLADMQADGDAQLQANYFHGQVSFNLSNVVVMTPGVYKVKLSASGYTYSPTEFIGWVKADTDRAVPVEGSEPTPANSPFDFEMYVLERVR